MRMETVVYKNSVVERHSFYSQCHALLDDISRRDYPGKNYFCREIDALDMDTYETLVCHGQKDCTADAVIGISTCVNKKLTAPRLLLVELRMDYESADNLSKSNMEGKVLHTKQLLGAEQPIDKESVFVFTEKVAPQARHWVESLKQEGGEITRFVVYSVQEFADNIRSYATMPYTPINAPAAIVKELGQYIEVAQWQTLFAKFHFWMEYATRIRYANSFEYENIKDTVVAAWRDFRESHSPMPNDDDEIDALIIEEDMDRMFG